MMAGEEEEEEDDLSGVFSASSSDDDDLSQGLVSEDLASEGLASEDLASEDLAASDSSVSDQALDVELDEEEEAWDSESDGYDSDDAERWGPYHWSDARSGCGEADAPAGTTTKAWDYVKYATFRTVRKLEFAGEVMVHFFGLDTSSYQYMIDNTSEEEIRQLQRSQQADVDDGRQLVHPVSS